MLSDSQGGIKYHFLCLWYDSTWDWAPISRTIDKHSTHEAKNDCLGDVCFDDYFVIMFDTENPWSTS